MYRSMLVPLDGSELAEAVCGYAKDLAGRLDMDVILLHVSGPSTEDILPMQLAYIDHMAEVVRRDIREVQKATAPEVTPRPVKVTGELGVGYSADEIIRAADARSVDLIVMASHGRSGLKRWTLGSVAGQVMSAARTPVWLIKAGTGEELPYSDWPRRSLVVPLDGSPLAESVLPHVEVLANQRGNQAIDVILVRVNEIMTIPTYYSSDISGVSLNWGSILQQETEIRKREAREYLESVASRLRKNGIEVKTEVIEGKANDEIVDFANKTPYSMIIMATHGRSGLSRLVYGSVAANILHGVNRPMFMIKPQQANL